MGCSIISSVQLGHTWTFTPSCSNLAEVKDSERKFVKTTTTKKSASGEQPTNPQQKPSHWRGEWEKEEDELAEKS